MPGRKRGEQEGKLGAMRRVLLHSFGFALVSGCGAPSTPQDASIPVVPVGPVVPVVPVMPASPGASPVPTTAEVPVVPEPVKPEVVTAEPVKPVAAATPAVPVAADPNAPAVAPPVIPDFGPLTPWVPRVPPDRRFELAAYRDGDMGLHLLGDQLFVSGGGGLAQLDARGDRLVHVEYGLSGQSEPYWWFDGWSTDSLAGRWPDNAWLTTSYGMSRSQSPPRVHRREGNVWKLQDTKAGMLYWDYSVVPWHSGQVLGLRRYAADPAYFEDGGEASKAVERKLAAAMAKVKPQFFVLGAKPTPASMVIAPGLRPREVEAAPTGELFMLAATKDNADATRMQRWGLTGDAAITGTVEELPRGMSCGGLTVRAADEVYAICRADRGGGSHLQRFDGKTWTEEPLPVQAQSISGVSIAPDGTMYAVVGIDGEGPDPIARRPAGGGAWALFEVPTVRFPDRAFPEWAFYTEAHDFNLLPPDPSAAAWDWVVYPQRVLARTDDDIWVLASTRVLERAGLSVFQQTREVVLRSKKVTEPLRMLPDGDLALEVLDWRAAKPWTPDGCTYGHEDQRAAFVPLRTLPRDAPRNEPEPTIEAFVRDNAALMGQVERVVEVFRRGRRTTGLFVRPTDQAGADALLAALEKVAPGEKRTIECRLPRIRREFDKVSGQAQQAPAL